MRSWLNMNYYKVNPPYEPRYVIPCVGNLTDEKFFVGVCEFPTAI
jgi:hypothetical protein